MSVQDRKRATRAELREELDSLRREVALLQPLSDRTEQAETELASFFVRSLDLLCIGGFDGYFKRLNPAWATSLGWSLEELQARPFLDFVHPGDREATLAEVEKLAAGAETIQFENRYRHQDGSYLWLRWNAQPVPGRQQIYAAARDVTRQKRLEREILEIADREKESLGRELHDGLCQTLAGIAALSSTLSRKLRASSESASAGAASEITELLNEAIREARDMARGLDPVALRDEGVEGALQVLASKLENRFGVSCELECMSPFPKLRLGVEVHLYRIAQQALKNAVTHGRAEGIEIRLSSKEGQGVLSVRDNGVGLPEEAPVSDGIGLRTMAYRSRLIGGSLEARRGAQKGTVVRCTFPLDDSSEED